MILFLRFSNIYPIRIAVVQKYIKKSKVDQLFYRVSHETWQLVNSFA